MSSDVPSATPPAGNPGIRRRWLIRGFVGLVLFAVASQIHFFYRDGFSYDYPATEIIARILRDGDLPLWNEWVGGGQPLAANPGALVFYPTTLLLLILPAHAVFNLHFLLHLALAFPVMRALLERLGVSQRGSSFGAVVFLASGVVASMTMFHFLVATVTLVPLAFLQLERWLERPSWRRTLQLGAVFGLVGLLGEPVTVVTVGSACGVVALGRMRATHGLRLGAAIGIAVIVASPLLLAHHEVMDELERFGARYSVETVFAASLTPPRLIEMIAGPYRGMPTDLGTDGFFASNPGARWPPFYPSLFIGSILLPALLVGDPRILRYRLLFVALLFFALGPANPVVRWLVESFEPIRILRYPEKLALPLTMAACALIGRFLDRASFADHERRSIWISVLVLIVSSAALAPALTPPSRTRLLIGSSVGVVTLGLALFRDRHPRMRLALSMAVLLPLVVSWVRTAPIDLYSHHRDPSDLASAVSGERIFREESEVRVLADKDAVHLYRIKAAGIDPVFGAIHDVRYALNRSPDGMYSYLSRIASERASLPAAQPRYLQLAGCAGMVSARPVRNAGLGLERSFDIGGNRLHLYRVNDPLPMVHAPGRAYRSRSIQEAVQRVEASDFDPMADVVVSPSRTEGILPSVEIDQVTIGHQSIRFRARTPEPSIVVINQSYFNGWNVTAGRETLPIFPANIDRLGVEVPAGESIVNVSFSRRRGAIGLAWLSSLLALALVAGVSVRRRPVVTPDQA